MKRFTETEKWKDPWFRTLPLHYKLFWLFIVDQCDNAGIWNPDLGLASFMIGFVFEGEGPSKDLLRTFEGRIKVLPNKRWLVVKYIDFQHGKLNPLNPCHRGVLKLLESNNIDSKNYCSVEGPSKLLPRAFQAPTKELPSSIGTGKGTSTGKGEGREGGVGEGILPATTQRPEPKEILRMLDTFWEAYPKKKNKMDAEHAFSEVQAWLFLPDILKALEWQKTDPDWLKDRGHWIPMPGTYLRDMRWKDEPVKPSSGSQHWSQDSYDIYDPKNSQRVLYDAQS